MLNKACTALGGAKNVSLFVVLFCQTRCEWQFFLLKREQWEEEFNSGCRRAPILFYPGGIEHIQGGIVARGDQDRERESGRECGGRLHYQWREH